MSRNDVASDKPTAVVIHSTRPAVLEAVTDFAATIEKAAEWDETFLRELLTARAPFPAHLQQLHAHAELLTRFLREVPWLRSTDLVRLYGVEPAEPARWKAERRIFSVMLIDVEQFPLFQFAAGRPIAGMRDVLACFAALSEWQIALWFFAPNAWLDEARPMDLLERNPEAVIEAARRAVEPIEA